MRKLDKFDISILETLQNKGRIPIRILSINTGLSQTPCYERIKRLEKDQLLKSYHAEINISKIVKTCFVYVRIHLKHHDQNDFITFEQAAIQFPEVLECYAVGGTIDYFMKLMIRDEAAFQSFMDSLMERDIGIHHYKAYFIMKSVKNAKGAPLTQLFTS